MTPCFANPNRKQTWVPPARLVIASLAAVIAASHHASAASGRNERSIESVQSRNAGEPIMAVVSRRNQQITVYDGHLPTFATISPRPGSACSRCPASPFRIHSSVKPYLTTVA
jgi:hypothetical protein